MSPSFEELADEARSGEERDAAVHAAHDARQEPPRVDATRALGLERLPVEERRVRLERATDEQLGVLDRLDRRVVRDRGDSLTDEHLATADELDAFDAHPGTEPGEHVPGETELREVAHDATVLGLRLHDHGPGRTVAAGTTGVVRRLHSPLLFL